MRTLAIRRGLVLNLALAATLSLAACAASKPPNGAAAGHSHTVPPAATPTPAHATSPPAPTHSGTPGGVENLVISSAEKSELVAAFAADVYPGIPISDLGYPVTVPGSVYYAYDPATDTYWALAHFEPTAPFSHQTAYMDGGNAGMFRKTGAGAWHGGMVAGPPMPLTCGEIQFFPEAVLKAWSLPTTPPAGATC